MKPQSVCNSGRQEVVRGIKQFDGTAREVRATQKHVGKARTGCALNGWCGCGVCVDVCVWMHV